MNKKIKSAQKWDEKFDSEEYRYGKTPNDFLKFNYKEIPKGKVLCIGEGEGRNSVFLAKQGYSVTALDFSISGLKKIEKLAKANGVEIELIHSDVIQYKFEQNFWQGIVSIFCHFDKPSREKVHSDCVSALTQNGIFLLEAYSPNQLKYGTGGPKTLDLLMDLQDVKNELNGLNFLYAQENVRERKEGTMHNGMSSVIQIIGRKV